MVMLLRIYIVRHGETASNRDGTIQGQLDTALNEEGLRQAALLALRLKAVPIHKAYTSDLQRAKKTAEIVLKYHPGVLLHEREDMRERFMGTLQGSKLPGIVRKAIMQDDGTIETTEQLVGRTLSWWKDVVLPLAHDAKRKLETDSDFTTVGLLATSHGAWISTLFNAMVAQGLVELVPGVSFTRCWNTSVSIVEVDESMNGVVTAYADVSHLLKRELVTQNVDEEEADSSPSHGDKKATVPEDAQRRADQP